MDVGAGRRVAAGTHHVVEYLRSPETIGLPLAPAHCPAVLIWRAQIVPSVDLARLSPSREPAKRAWHGAVILAYQEAPGKPLRYGALLVDAAPQETWVGNDMACPLPEESAAFQYFTCACFAHREQAIPILDATRLFSDSLPWTPIPHEGEAEAAVNPVETTSATLAASDTPRPSTEAPQVLEQATPHTEALPETSAHQCALVEETLPVESSTDASRPELDFLPDPVTGQLSSESPPWTPSPDEGEAEAAVNPLETTPATPAASDTPRPSTEAPQVLEQATPHTEALPSTSEPQCTPVEETTAIEPSTDAGGRELDFACNPVAPASEARPHVPLLMPPATVPASSGNHTVAIAELTAEERQALRRQLAQQIIEETVTAIHDEVCLTRVLFAVLARDGRSVRAHYYRGLEADSPLRRFCFERKDSSLFARLAERPQHVWLHAGNRNRLAHLLSAEMRESLGESELCASSIFVRWRFVGVCYGDEFPSTDGLDKHRYGQFKDLCNGMVRRLWDIAT